MRSHMLFAAIGVVACASPQVQVVAREGASTLDDLLRRHPLAAATNIRADEIHRTPAASIHLVQVQGRETPHRHVQHDLAITVLRGRGVLTLDGTARRLEAGDVAVIPRGAAHHFARTGASPAIALVVFAPPLDTPDSVPADGENVTADGVDRQPVPR
jgi:quercetin dioxygenase-like cupin family protein